MRDPHRVGLARRSRVDHPAAHDARRPALPADRRRRRHASSRSIRIGAPPEGVRAALSRDFGRTWDPADEVELYGSQRRRRAARHGGRRPRATTGTRWAPGSSAIRAASHSRTARSSRSSMQAKGQRGAPAGRASRWRRKAPMKITKIESRIIGYDVAEAWLPEGPPEGIASTWYQYCLDAFHTDEGIVGYTMQNTNIEDGAQMADVLHSAYAPQLLGEDPLAGRVPVAQAPALQPPRLQPVRRRSPAPSTSRSGTSAARSPTSRSRCCSGSRARRCRPTRPRRPFVPSPRPLQRGQARRRAGLPRLQDPVLGRPRPRHPALPRGARGGRRRLPADAGRRRHVLLHPGAGGRPRARPASDYYWFEEPIPDRNASS